MDYDVLLDLSLEERANASDYADTHFVWLIFLRRLGVGGGGGCNELPAENDAGGEEKVAVPVG